VAAKKIQKKVQKKPKVEAIPKDIGPVPDTVLQQARKAKMEATPATVPVQENGHDKLSARDKEMVTVNIDFDMRFANKAFEPGHHTVPRHVADQLKHMNYVKHEKNKSVHIGKKYQWKKGAGRKIPKLHDDL
jgi:hypothetical protein